MTPAHEEYLEVIAALDKMLKAGDLSSRAYHKARDRIDALWDLLSPAERADVKAFSILLDLPPGKGSP